jgi:OOP family OmpA-OmpF porin
MKAFLVIMLSYLTILSVGMAAEGYVTDGSGKIVKTGTGLCLHTGSYTESNAVKGCDLVPVVPVVQSLKSDVLFAFDSSVITTEGKLALDQVAKTLTTSNKVSVVGHTDPIGTKAYNDRLSRLRSDAVAQYLDSKVKALYESTGVGSSQPTEGSNLCVGLKNQERLIKCFAPDRRVTLTIK